MEYVKTKRERNDKYMDGMRKIVIELLKPLLSKKCLVCGRIFFTLEFNEENNEINCPYCGGDEIEADESYEEKFHRVVGSSKNEGTEL